LPFPPRLQPPDQVWSIRGIETKVAGSAVDSSEVRSMLSLDARDVTGLNCYTLYLPGIKICIKMDHRPTPMYWMLAIQHPSQFTLIRSNGDRVRHEGAFLQHIVEGSNVRAHDLMQRQQPTPGELIGEGCAASVWPVPNQPLNKSCPDSKSRHTGVLHIP
jgi:hypothetical protein